MELSCQHCHSTFEAPAAEARRRRYCSVACYAAAPRKSSKVERTCQHCGATFMAWPAWVRKGAAKFCSRECKHAADRERPSYERTPEHRALMSARLKGREAIPHAIEAAAAARRGQAPSEGAREIARERWEGAGNPQWKDGRAARRYGPGYGRRVRRAVIERDRACVDCGLWDERPHGMHIHHLDGTTDNHDLANLVLLCLACHQRRHARYRVVT